MTFHPQSQHFKTRELSFFHIISVAGVVGPNSCAPNNNANLLSCIFCMQSDFFSVVLVSWFYIFKCQYTAFFPWLIINYCAKQNIFSLLILLIFRCKIKLLSYKNY